VKLLPPTAFLPALLLVFMWFACRTHNSRRRALRFAAATLLAGQTLTAVAALPVERIKLPPGFHI
jgi:hypothetical protein